MLRWLISLIALFVALPASAHEVRPAYLEIIETAPGAFNITWKQPLTDGRRLIIDPVLPGTCAALEEPKLSRLNSTVVKRWSVSCELQGAEIEIEGLDRTLTDVFARAEFLDGTQKSALLRSTSTRFDLSGDAPAGDVVSAYLRIGIDHIIFGPDHLLFVLGLVLLVRGWQIIGVATAFTLAHSVTLAWTALGGAALPQTPVEILIAASILLLAVEIMHLRLGKPSLAARRPWAIALFIGLIHGFGFAGALAEIGLPRGQELISLLLFNLGVEIGQIVFIAFVVLGLWVLARIGKSARSNTEFALTYAIGTIGAFWMLERLGSYVA